VGDERNLFFASRLESVGELVLGNDAVLHQAPGQAREVGS